MSATATSAPPLQMVLPSLQMALVLLTTRAAVQGPEEVSSPRWALDGRRISASLRAAHSSCVSKLDKQQEHDPGGRSKVDRLQGGAMAPPYSCKSWYPVRGGGESEFIAVDNSTFLPAWGVRGEKRSRASPIPDEL